MSEIASTRINRVDLNLFLMASKTSEGLIKIPLVSLGIFIRQFVLNFVFTLQNPTQILTFHHPKVTCPSTYMSTYIVCWPIKPIYGYEVPIWVLTTWKLKFKNMNLISIRFYQVVPMGLRFQNNRWPLISRSLPNRQAVWIGDGKGFKLRFRKDLLWLGCRELKPLKYGRYWV